MKILLVGQRTIQLHGCQFTLRVLLALTVTTFANAEESPSNWEGTIKPGHVRPHVEFLASRQLGGRAGADAVRAAAYLRKQFETCRLKPLFAEESYEQLIPGTESEAADADDPLTAKSISASKSPPIVGRNVGAWIEGSDPELRKELIVIGVHFDHLGTRNGAVFRGADDNATGTAMMLEVARQFSLMKERPKRSVVFVGFDMEEQLLWGSRWFVAHPPWPIENVKLFITADMIGRSLGDLPLPTVFVMGSEHAHQLKTTLNQVGSPRGLEVARLGIDLIGVRSDYGPFWSEKVPFLFLSTGEHPDYHTPRDVPEKIDFDKVAAVSSLVLNVVQFAANSEQAPIWTDDVSPDVDEVKAVLRITQLLLEADGQRRFTDLQRLIVTQAQNKCQQLLAKGTFTVNDRKWLIRTSQLLLLSVF
ncbi:MAG: M20/M25/M40 family metallo-hydrolase [Planctomycetia bacterium]|nr:M20/M25/M40 family metallo-hydrolase [Planctomycetia bacterium]